MPTGQDDDAEGSEARLRRGPHVFVEDLGAAVLRPEDDQHLRRALRRRDGDVLTASDGQGRWRPFRLGAELLPDGPVVERSVAGPTLTVATALAKGERPEWTVQKLTELGIDRIVLLACARATVRWEGPRADRHRDRLARVAREAAMQSRRCTLPEVLGPVPPAALAGPGAAVAEPGGAALDATVTTVLVGPEGGWSPDERAGLGPAVGLGATVLRAETAALAAGVLLVERHRGWRGWTGT